MRVAFGGAINLEYPGYSAETTQLLQHLGVDFEALREASPNRASEGCFDWLIEQHAGFQVGVIGDFVE